MPKNDQDRWFLFSQVIKMLQERGRLPANEKVRFESIEGEYTLEPGNVMPGERPKLFVSPEGCVVVHDENGATLYEQTGQVMLLRKDGCLEITNPRIDRIEIDDLAQVQSLQIKRIFQTTSHLVEFTGGGTFSFVTDATGKVIETMTRNVQYRFLAGC